jgi:predicted nucleic acid-binding protein
VAVDPEYLIDNSAWNRLKYDSVAARLRPLADAGVIASCGAQDLEALYSANTGEYESLRNERLAIFTYLETEEADWQRALTVQRELAKKSQHRGVKIVDLLTAAIAEHHGLVLLHYDSDYDRVAEVTGQRAEWVVPRGSAG